MKTLQCDKCEVTAEGETFEAWMEALKPHYMTAHIDEMKKHMDKSEEEQKKLMGEWMEENKVRYEAA